MQKLNEKGLTKTALLKELSISSRTMAKIRWGEKIANHVLEKGLFFFNCSMPDYFR